MKFVDFEALRSKIGSALFVDPVRLEEYRSDKSGSISSNRPSALVEARSVGDVQATLEFANSEGIPVVPRGAGTGLAGGAIGDAGEIVLSMLKMNRVLEISSQDLTAVVEPGVINAELNEQLRTEGLWYSPDPASQAISTIGGNIATNAGGLLCAKYGVTRDSVLGLTVVLADGQILKLGRRTVKGVTGLDLTSLIVGSEGTLAVIVEATLRLKPIRPDRERTLVANFSDVVGAANAAARITSSDLAPAVMEIMDEFSVGFVNDYLNPGSREKAFSKLIVQFDDQDADSRIERATSLIGNTAVSVEVDRGAGESESLFAFRRAFHPALAARGRVLIEDVAVPRSAMPAMFREIQRISTEFEIPIPTVAHAGDGNLHPNFLVDSEGIPARVWDAASELFHSALKLGGTLTGEHGVGTLKKRWLSEEIGDAQLDLQRRIKQVFDPRGILNPGKMFDERVHE